MLSGTANTVGKKFCWKMRVWISHLAHPLHPNLQVIKKTSSIIQKELSSQYPFLNFCFLWGAFSPRQLRSFSRRIWELAEVKLWSDEIYLLLEKNNKYFMHSIAAVVTRPVDQSSFFFFIIIIESHNPTKLFLVLWLGWDIGW